MNNPRYSGYQGGSAVQSAPALLGQVLGITGVGFLITALAAYLFRGVSQMVATIAFFAGFAMIFVMRSVRRNPAVALLWFYAFTFVEGIGIAPLISHYTAVAGAEVVVDAAATTGFGMLVLGGVAFTFSIDWRRFQGIAFGALLVARARRHRLDLLSLHQPRRVCVGDPGHLHAAHAGRLQSHPRRRRRPDAPSTLPCRSTSTALNIFIALLATLRDA